MDAAQPRVLGGRNPVARPRRRCQHYFAEAQRPARNKFLLARTSGDAQALLGSMRRELLAIEPGLVFMANSTMEQNLGMNLMPARIALWCDRVLGGAPHA